MVGKRLDGTCSDPELLQRTKATWDERLAVLILIVAIAGLGLSPLWMSDLIQQGVTTVISHILN